METADFIKLQKEIRKKNLELSRLQAKHRKETGKDFILGQPINTNFKKKDKNEPEFRIPSNPNR